MLATAGARGVFTAPATDIMGNRTDTFKFSNGTFRVRHSPGHGKAPVAFQQIIKASGPVHR